MDVYTGATLPVPSYIGQAVLYTEDCHVQYPSTGASASPTAGPISATGSHSHPAAHPETTIMACRVGMSTDPEERIAYWKRQEGHTHSRILHSRKTYSQALKLEKDEAEARGCRFRGGGERKDGAVYSVYHVWGGR